MVRLFAGLTLPDTHRQRLVMLQNGLKGARWVAADTMHITLRFIGEVDENVAEDLCKAFAHITVKPFMVEIASLGTFGSPPHHVWAGVNDSDGALAHLHAKLDSACVRTGLEPEGRKYTPHATLARFAKRQRFQNANRANRLGEYLGIHDGFALDPFPVTGFTLFQSHLSHLGAVYTPFAEFDF